MLGISFVIAALCGPVPEQAVTPTYDVVVYGGTSAGVAAAVQAARMGKSVVLIEPGRHLGGLTSGGLGWTDTGNKAVIGGIAREFYGRVWQHYQRPDAWRWQKQEEYGNRGQGTPAIDGNQRTMWIFEPHVAEDIFDQLVAEAGVRVVRNQRLDLAPGRGVGKTGTRITEIRMESGQTYRGTVFIDATYEGDVMAKAGVAYHVGREANSVYDETWNGIQVGVLHHSHWFKKPIDPYVQPGDPSSGLLPRISPDPPGEKGAGDHRVQAYCFRMCLTNVPENRVPFPKPDGYDAEQYALLLRVFDSGWREVFGKFDPIPNSKTDTNNHGPFSTDNIGMNYDYPDGDHAERERIFAEHVTYQQGLMYFLANDPRVPEQIRSEMSTWGLAKDEFVDSGHWPHQMYIREARRMIGQYVMTEHDCLARRVTPDPIGMGSYTMDSHNVQRYVTPEGHVQNEGDIGVSPPRPYQIAYGTIVPQRAHCTNLLVPVCVSSSHIAFGSIRMEPVFMILGQSAATAAVQAIERNQAVQDVDYAVLRTQLLLDKQVLELPDSARPRGAVRADQLPGTTIDDRQAALTGNWSSSSSITPFVDLGYRHDADGDKGRMTARFEAELEDGRYEVRVYYSPNPNRASNVPVTVFHADGQDLCRVDQKRAVDDAAGYAVLGTFRFRAGAPAAVQISNADTDGHVIIDAVQFLPQEPAER
jgi:hypothetical protein